MGSLTKTWAMSTSPIRDSLYEADWREGLAGALEGMEGTEVAVAG